jgi:UDP-glucose 4-epimerase
MKKILISGASGFIGSITLDLFSNHYKDVKIFALYNNTEPNIIKKNIEPIKIDLRFKSEYKRLPSNYDSVVHLAGNKKTFLNDKLGLDQFNDNLKITKLLAENAVKAKCENFVFASSVYIYSDTSTQPFVEDYFQIPNEHLGLSKLACELMLKTFSLNNYFKTLNMRIFTAYGSNSPHDQFIPSAINKIKNKSKTEKFGNPNIFRDFIHVNDVAKSFMLGLEILQEKDLGFFDSLNIATGKSINIKEVVNKIISTLDTKKKIIFDEKLFSNSGNNDHYASLDKLKATLNWIPKITFDEGLKSILFEEQNE